MVTTAVPASRSPPGLRWVWVCFALAAVASAWNAVVDAEERGDPADTVAHELVAVAPFAAAVAGLLAVAVLRLRRGAEDERIGAPEVLLGLGAIDVLVALARLSIGDVTGPHDGDFAYLFDVGVLTVLCGTGWASVRQRRGRSPAGRAVRDHTSVAFVVAFAALAVIALVGWVVGPPGPAIAASLVWSAALMWGFVAVVLRFVDG